MKNKILILVISFLLLACVMEVKYTLSDPKDAVILNEFQGNFMSEIDSAEVEIKLQESKKMYDLYFKNDKDSIVEHHKAFLSLINDIYFLNFSTINQLKSDKGKELYQFYKVYNIDKQNIKLLPVSDSLFKDKEFQSEKEFRDYFKSNLDNTALFKNEKENLIQLKKID